MRLCPLSKYQHKVKVGQPLPFSIRDSSGRLLLARAHLLSDEAQFEALLERGALVDLDELTGPRSEALSAPPELLPTLWRAFAERTSVALHAPPGPNWVPTLEELARLGLTLVERSPDLAIFLIVRGESPPQVHYGVMHSIHTMGTVALVGRRLGWDEPRVLTAMRAALTMNLSIIDLQGRLSTQTDAPTAIQRGNLRGHPQRSVAMLQAVGVSDEAWLTAVAQHHESPDGRGYPQGLTTIDELAQVLRVADIFTAKLSPRATRPALPACDAAKRLFAGESGSPVCAALIKEFGIYPPGCLVALQSGEVGVVSRRGASANAPLVDALIGRNGEPLLGSVRRDSGHGPHAIVKVVSAAKVPVRVAPEKIFAERAV